MSSGLVTLPTNALQQKISGDIYLTPNLDVTQGTGSLYTSGDHLVIGKTQLNQTSIDTTNGPLAAGGANNISLATTSTTAVLSLSSSKTGTGALTLSSVGGTTIDSTDVSNGVKINTANSGVPTFIGTSAGATTVNGNLNVLQNLTVTGNLTVTTPGTKTVIDTQSTTVTDNFILLNAGPGTVGSDAGFVARRYQTANGTGLGDVVTHPNPIQESGITSGAGSTTTVKLAAYASSTDSFYVGSWIKMTSGTVGNIGSVRRIKTYIGSTKIATIYTTADGGDGLDFTSATASGDGYQLYTNPYVGMGYIESSDSMCIGFTQVSPPDTIGTTASNMAITQYTPLQAGSYTARPQVFYNANAAASGTTITITILNHGLVVGNTVAITSSSGLTPTLTSGNYTVTSVSTNSFTITAGASTTSTSASSVTVTFNQTSSVVYANTIALQDPSLGSFNFLGTIPGLPLNEFVTIAQNSTTPVNIVNTASGVGTTNNYIIQVADTAAGGATAIFVVVGGSAQNVVSRLAQGKGSLQQRLDAQWLTGNKVQLFHAPACTSGTANLSYKVRVFSLF